MSAQVLLVEASPRRVADGVVEVVRLAGAGAVKPYRYPDAAGGADQSWRAGVVSLPTIICALEFDGTDLGTGAIPQAAEIVWAPARSADLDALAAYFWFDAAIKVRIGPEGASPPVVITGKVLSAPIVDGQLRLQLADPAASLKKPFPLTRYLGTGDLEGPIEWSGKLKDRVWGRVWNKLGEPLDKANNIYAFADPARPLQSIDAVRDKGATAAALTTVAWQGTTAATLAALRAAVAPQGGGVTCPSLGCMKWWTQPAGDLCADLKGEIGAGYVETTASIATALVSGLGGPAFAAGTVAAANAARPAPVGWVIGDDTTTVAGMLDELLGNVSLLWVLSLAGEIVIRQWAWGASAAAAKSHKVTRNAVLRPVHTRKIGYKRNELPMARGDLAAIVLATEATYLDGTSIEALKPAQIGSDKTGTNTAAAIAGQAATATSSDFNVVTGATKPANNATVGGTVGTNILKPGGTIYTQAELQTDQGTAAAIAGQGPAATAPAASVLNTYNQAFVDFDFVGPETFVQLGTSFYRSTGGFGGVGKGAVVTRQSGRSGFMSFEYDYTNPASAQSYVGFTKNNTIDTAVAPQAGGMFIAAYLNGSVSEVRCTLNGVLLGAAITGLAGLRGTIGVAYSGTRVTFYHNGVPYVTALVADADQNATVKAAYQSNYAASSWDRTAVYNWRPMFAAAASSWAEAAGTGKPSDYATAGIGFKGTAGATVVGSNYRQTTNTSSGNIYTVYAYALALKGGCYASFRWLGTGSVQLGLFKTSAPAVMSAQIRLLSDGTLSRQMPGQASLVTIQTGIVAGDTIGLGYDGVNYYVTVNGAPVYSAAALEAGLEYVPKWAIVSSAITDASGNWHLSNLEFIPISDNSFVSIGGLGKVRADYVTPEGTAAAISGQGAFATVSSVAYGSGFLTGFGALAARAKIALGDGFVFRADGTTALSDALAVTSLGTAAAIAGQGGLATRSSITFNTTDIASMPGPLNPANLTAGYLRADWMVYPDTVTPMSALKPGEAGANVTEARTAAAIAGQAAAATDATIEAGADVTSYVDGSAEVVINASNAGVPVAGQLPKASAFKLWRNGVDKTTLAAWSVTTIAGSFAASIGPTTGILSIDASGGVLTSGKVRLTSVYGGTTRTKDVIITRSDAPQDTGGGGGGTGTNATTSINANVSSTTPVAITGVSLIVTAGSGGQVYLSSSYTFSSSGVGFKSMSTRWQRKISGTWTDIGSAKAADSAYYLGSDGEEIQGQGSHAETIAGLGAGTTGLEFRLTGYLPSGAVTRIAFGSAGAVGS